MHKHLFALVIFTSCCFADNPDNTTVLEISKDRSFVTTLTFTAPGEKKITLENHLAKDVEIGYLYFFGDTELVETMSKSISLIDHDACSTIKAKTTCSYIINGNNNANHTPNPEGEQFFLNYKVSSEATKHFIKLNIKIDYHNEAATKPLRSTTTGAAIGFVAVIIDKTIKQLAVAVIGNPNAAPQNAQPPVNNDHIITSTIIGLLTGLGVQVIDSTNKTIDPMDETYNNQLISNKIMETAALHSSIGLVMCKGRLDYASCVTNIAMCGLTGGLVGQFILYDPVSYVLVPYLPKAWQKIWHTGKTTTTFTVSATIRGACKCKNGLPNGLLYEIYQDMITGSTLIDTSQTSSVPTDNTKSCSVCTCEYLPDLL